MVTLKNKTPAINGAELAVISSKFQGICQQMANTLMRTGRSGVLNTAHDFSCCILNYDNSFIAADESLPVHVLSGPDIMARNIDKYHPKKEHSESKFEVNNRKSRQERDTNLSCCNHQGHDQRIQHHHANRYAAYRLLTTRKHRFQIDKKLITR